ncbi:hypothetical protein BDR26DRAFT_859178 [Obelidium mucronatum]|nr:hypothetical protein BDR26DRAFT_859178 [Obelidium mucronatum]
MAMRRTPAASLRRAMHSLVDEAPPLAARDPLRLFLAETRRTPKPTELLNLIHRSEPAHLRHLQLYEWNIITDTLGEGIQRTPKTTFKRLQTVFDYISQHDISGPTQTFFKAYLASAVASTSPPLSAVDIERLLVTIQKLTPKPIIFRSLYLFLANKFCLQSKGVLAWKTIKTGSDIMAKAYGSVPSKDFVVARMTPAIVTALYTCVSFVGFDEPKANAQAREIIKQMIQMQKADGQFIGDYGFIVLAKVCVSARGTNNDARYTSDAVKEYLDWVKSGEVSGEIPNEAYAHLIFHSIRGNDLPLAIELLEKINYAIHDHHICKRVLREISRTGKIDLASKVYQTYLSIHNAALDSILVKKEEQKEHPFELERQERQEKDGLFMVQQEMAQVFAMQPEFSNEGHTFLQSFSEQEISNWSFNTFRCVIPYYVRARKASTALYYFDLMKKTPMALKALEHSEPPSSLPPSESKLSTETRHLVKYHETYRTLESLFNQILYAFSRSSQIKEPLQFYHTNSAPPYNFKLTYETCSILIATYAFTHPTEGNQFLQDFETRNAKPADVVIYTALISSHIRGNRLTQAIQLFQRMKQVKVEPNVQTFNAVIHGLCMAEKPHAALEFLKTMERAKCPPDTTTFNTIMNAYLKTSAWKEAEAVSQMMEDYGVEWDVKTFNTWINAHMRRDGGDLEEAGRLFKRMQEAPYFFRPSTFTYDAHLYFHVYRRDWKAAEEILQKMHPLVGAGGSSSSSTNSGGGISSVGIGSYREELVRPSWKTNSNIARLKSYRIFINGLCANERLDKAHEYYRRLMDQGMGAGTNPQEDANISSIRVSLIKAAAKKGDLEYCQKIYADFMEGTRGASSDSLNAAMISAYSNYGDLDGAINWADKVIAGAGKGNATLAKIRGWVGKRQQQHPPTDELDGDSILSSAVKFGRGSSYSLMLAYAKAGDLESMQAIHSQLLRLESWGYGNSKELKNPGSKYSIHEGNVLITCYGLLGRGDFALDVWKDLWQNQRQQQQQQQQQNSSSFRIARGPASTSSRGLALHYGVDRVTISVIIDALSFSNMTPELDRMWHMLKKVYPMDLNNYISYSESLARRGDYEACLAFVEGEMIDGTHGLEMEPKIFWSVLKLLNNSDGRASFEALWALMKRRYPKFEPAVTEILEAK